MNNQHVQVPKMDLTEQGLTTLDPYIYACIKKYMNSKTQQAFPSNTTLQQVSGLGNKTIIESIKRLEKAGYISITREFGKSNVYTFNDYKKFEICSYDLLDRTDLTPKEKAYFIAAQPYMFKDNQSGYITFNSEKLAASIGLSLNTLKKYESSLCQKNMIQLVPIRTCNATGLTEYNRVYDFDQWSNIVALKFQEQDERINDHDHQINRLKDEIEFLKQELKRTVRGSKDYIMTEVVQESKSITVDITPQTLYKKYIKWVSPILGISSQLEADALEYICLHGLNSDTYKQLNITPSLLSEVVSSLQGKRLLTLEGKPGDMIDWEIQNMSQLKVTFEIK